LFLLCLWLAGFPTQQNGPQAYALVCYTNWLGALCLSTLPPINLHVGASPSQWKS